MRKFPVLILVGLAACGTPQEQCLNRATRETRTLESMLATVEDNLARGYAWEEYQDTITRWEVCGYDTITKPNGKEIARPRMCLDDDVITRERRVAIDPLAERRKAEGLRARIAAMRPQVQANIAACRATYPE